MRHHPAGGPGVARCAARTLSRRGAAMPAAHGGSDLLRRRRTIAVLAAFATAVGTVVALTGSASGATVVPACDDASVTASSTTVNPDKTVIVVAAATATATIPIGVSDVDI